MINILIHGIGGKMGKVVYQQLQNNDEAVACVGVDKYANKQEFNIPVYDNLCDVKEKVDCIIDFSVKQAIYDLIPYAVEKKLPVVVATTGFTSIELTLIDKASKEIPIFRSGNMSLGVNVIGKLVKDATRMLGDKADIEIIESHHNQKVDAPSGTALMLLDNVKEAREVEAVYGRVGQVGKRTANEVGMHAVRGGSIVGKHEVMFILNNEVITIKHEAESKSVFANGAIKASVYLAEQEAGLYDMNTLLASM